MKQADVYHATTMHTQQYTIMHTLYYHAYSTIYYHAYTTIYTLLPAVSDVIQIALKITRDGKQQNQ